MSVEIADIRLLEGLSGRRFINSCLGRLGWYLRCQRLMFNIQCRLITSSLLFQIQVGRTSYSKGEFKFINVYINFAN